MGQVSGRGDNLTLSALVITFYIFQLNMALEVGTLLESITSRKGVKCVVVMNHEGEPLQTVCNSPEVEGTSLQLARLAFQVAVSTRTFIHQYDSQEDLHFLRLRMSDSEIMIVPEKKYLMIVIQDPKTM